MATTNRKAMTYPIWKEISQRLYIQKKYIYIYIL